MSVNRNHTLGTFFRAGERLTGIIHTSAFQGRMVFRPDGHEEGRLIASINGWRVGHADRRIAAGSSPEYDVVLDQHILAEAFRAELVLTEHCYILRTQ